MGISGKCGFQETVEIYGAQNILDKYKVYAANNEIIPLKMESEKDLVAYYTYGTPFMSGGKDGGVIMLSSESYIDTEEREDLQWNLKELQKYYKKCKRNKISFDKEEALKKITLFWPPEDYQIELVDRVAEKGNKATIEGLHTQWHDSRRKEWFDLMVDKYDWDKNRAYRWVYGWNRWYDMLKVEEYGKNTVQVTLDL